MPHFISFDLGLPSNYHYELSLFFNLLKWNIDWANIKYSVPDLDLRNTSIKFLTPNFDKSLLDIHFPAIKHWEITADQHVDFWFLPEDSPIKLIF